MKVSKLPLCQSLESVNLYFCHLMIRKQILQRKKDSDIKREFQNTEINLVSKASLNYPCYCSVIQEDSDRP